MDALPKVEAMLERQARAWNMNQRLIETSAQELPREGPWITMSRQLGSGGNELAQRLAGELGWQVFDREILGTIAEHTHTREAVLAHLDEHAIGPLIDYISRLLRPELPGQADFVREMLRVVWGLAKRGQAVILGRGANWFLDPRFGLRLRVVAPLETRVRQIVEREGIAPALAEKRLREIDERQEEFVRKVFGRAIDDPLGYDLTLNMGSVDPETAARTVLAALRQRIRHTAVLEGMQRPAARRGSD